MTMTDPIADLLTRIRNVNSLQRTTVSAPHSIIKEKLLDTLKREGFIEDYSVSDAKVGKELNITLKFGPDGEKVINKIDRVSTPGRRVFKSTSELGRVLQGMGIWILSTNKGILSDNEARAQNVGGEVLCKVF